MGNSSGFRVPDSGLRVLGVEFSVCVCVYEKERERESESEMKAYRASCHTSNLLPQMSSNNLRVIHLVRSIKSNTGKAVFLSSSGNEFIPKILEYY